VTGSLVYGRRPVLEALRSGRSVRTLWLAEGMREAPVISTIVQAAQDMGIPTVGVPRRRLDELTDGAHHQGVVAEAAALATVELDDLLAAARRRREPPLLVALDRLEDPQNLGSLIRSAEAAGAHGLVLPAHRSAGLTPAVERASAGATEHLPVADVVNLTRALRELKSAGLWVIGLDAAAEQRHDQADLTVPLVLVVGGEGRGLSRLVAEQCDLLVRLPMAGRVASLNAAVAGAIVLYEAVRQRGGE
jgi:23S rRNA (guanosine2251-2'-O)-methyltransferase